MTPTLVWIAVFAPGGEPRPFQMLPREPTPRPRAGGNERADDLPELYTISGPYFAIPCNATSKNLAGIQLYVSDNRGASWSLYSEATPGRSSFLFRAKHQGEYWFATRVKYKDGTFDPTNTVELVPELRVAVGNGAEPAAQPKLKSKSSLAESADELDKKLTEVELRLIEKEIGRLGLADELTPEVEAKILNLRGKLRAVRERLQHSDQPTTSGLPTTVSEPDLRPVPSPYLPNPSPDRRIPRTNLPVRPVLTPRLPARPVAPPPHSPAQRW